MEADLIESIERVLDEKVRPYLASHGGNVVVVGIEGDLLRIRLSGRCSGCLTADLETESLIKAEIQASCPTVREVVLVSGVSESLLEQVRSLMSVRQ